MALTRTWIDTNLSHSQRTALVDWLLERTTAPTGELIRSGLAELFPDLADELPSVQACITWKNKVWARELQRRELREQAEAARVLAEATGGDELAEASKTLMASIIFDQLQALKQGDSEAGESLHDFVLSYTRLNDAQVRAAKHDAEVEKQRKADEATKPPTADKVKDEAEIRSMALRAVDEILLGRKRT